MKKIYILHGWTYSTDAWNECCSALKARGFECVMLNVPGLSESSEKVWTLEEYVFWLHEKLQGQSDIILLGHSNGGRIVSAYAAQYPDTLKYLILEDSAGIVHNEWPLRMKRKIFGTIAKIGKKFITSQKARKVFYKIIGAHDYERAPENMRKTMSHLISRDLRDIFASIKTPTLIIWGRKDQATPLSDAFVIHNLMNHSKLVIIKDAAHSPHKTHSERVAKEIEAFTA